MYKKACIYVKQMLTKVLKLNVHTVILNLCTYEVSFIDHYKLNNILLTEKCLISTLNISSTGNLAG